MVSAPVRSVLFAVSLAAAGCATTGAGAARYHIQPGGGGGPRLLCVVAHPDDEIAFAGTLYKAASHLGAACDVLTITNGEAGYKYATLAEPLYGLRLTDPEVGRRELPEIRRRELMAGCRFLGVRDLIMLRQRDPRYTLDPAEVIGAGGAWDVAFVRRVLRETLAAGRYDFVLTHLPVPGTHGHHKAATILALTAVAELPPAARPVVLGCRPDDGSAEGEAAAFTGLPGWDVTAVDPREAPLSFDRSQKFGFRDRLDYRIVARWAVAEHKSQGTMQLVGDWVRELYHLYALPVPNARSRAEQLFARLAEPQFEALDYDDDGELRR